MKRQTPETAVTNKIIDLLHLKGYKVKKIYNGAIPARVFGSQIIYRKKNDEYKGIPDLLAYNEHNFFFIEVKREDGKAKPEQKEFIESFNQCTRHEAFVVHSVEELLEKL